MIIHKLVAHHLRRRDDQGFYELQADDAIRWIQGQGVKLAAPVAALDLGAGSGLFGARLSALGCTVTFADEKSHLAESLRGCRFVQFRIGADPWSKLDEFDLVIFSNVLEHIENPRDFISNAHRLLKPGGYLYLSWTNWLSPWGGHDFSPFQYLGPRWGPKLSDRLRKRKTIFTLGSDLFPTYIGETLRWVRSQPQLRVVAKAPRYYPELSWLASLPLLREFLCWNTALLIQRKPPAGQP